MLTRLAFPTEKSPVSELTVILTDDAAMPDYKARCFGVRVQTDVVCQAYAALPGICAATAEIIVNAQRAQHIAHTRPGGPARELALYMAHGLNHLAGATDSTPAQRRSMRRRETAWLSATAEIWKEIVAP